MINDAEIEDILAGGRHGYDFEKTVERLRSAEKALKFVKKREGECFAECSVVEDIMENIDAHFKAVEGE